MKINLNSVQDTIKFGEKLGKLLIAGDIIFLNGDLGAGKTTLSKSIGEGLGVQEYITSPTFTLINEYEGRLPLYHFDLYRLDSYEELEELGVEDYFYGNGVCLIEWAEKFSEDLPENRLEVWINRGKTDDERYIKLKEFGDRYKKLIEELA
ncbi:MAG: tRNA (adenosine(37)-N6)-threonylcarbamoyltransferase complex ATPase subunit type 1 TsaE [Tissierellia bacterium]|nr:tRNA (adenosine(37)-N6)-threonylcarbamoyltransferase complex ATPase subunit type 1 TsaE [Tissierellia bacterium]